MMLKLVVYAAREIAQLVHCYFDNDSEYDVVAFCGGRHE
jgi:hypothetical protein